ncbi:DUF1905 domain-containing protein [Cellulomonas fengjieae]|uniref:DUF1905 domain-containing protein n=1 Tax=Cellulomonas fengjieae TaxID=2819978 RepID=A0ABS3SJT7_9CELL|nr:DUF1905 domain-containing protein [Cellulomonas fengjieae]MBO3086011.1 DUF1905 domain-containing protein [Cellulomonas fengjieae]QVI65920.1 DUF1905 domain-containing protein [Cellulomonas fengjieae]
MELEFTGEIIYWRGPSPFHYVPVPEQESAAIKAVSAEITYGWGVIPVLARIDDTEWETSLFPKDGRYLVPVKDAVRKAELLDLGDVVTVRLVLGGPR